MIFTDTECAGLAQAANTLSERLDEGRVPGDVSNREARRQIELLRQVTGRTGVNRFSAVLQTLGVGNLSDEELVGRLASTAPEDAPMPPWVRLLQALLQYTSDYFRRPNADASFGRLLAKRGHLPFEHLFWPMADFAWNRVVAQMPAAETMFSESALAALQKYLLSRLTAVVAEALWPSYLAHLAVWSSATFGSFSKTVHNDDAAPRHRQRYIRFITQQGQQGMRSFFLAHATGGRLVAESTQSWIEFVVEFIRHFQEDRPLLSDTFAAGKAIKRIATLKAGTSDPHRGGRSVLIVGLGSEGKIVYKPHALQVDRHFFGLIRALNATGKASTLPDLKVLDRGTHGWMEFAEHRPCPDQTAAKRYYGRAGALACLVHWLQGIDCHRENLVAVGEHPVLVDLETLAHPTDPNERFANTAKGALRLERSVLRTGLLPLWEVRIEGKGWYNHSGLNAPTSCNASRPTTTWRNVNTDRMRLNQVVHRLISVRHRPVVNGRVLDIRKHQAAVLRGFRRMADLLEGASSEQLSQWQTQIRGCVRRHIKRPTRIYDLLIKRSLRPGCLVSGVNRSIELQALPESFEGEAVRAGEISSMEQLDIPYFETTENDFSAPTDAEMSPHLSNQIGVVALSLRYDMAVREGRVFRMSAERGRKAKNPSAQALTTTQRGRKSTKG